MEENLKDLDTAVLQHLTDYEQKLVNMLATVQTINEQLRAGKNLREIEDLADLPSAHDDAGHEAELANGIQAAYWLLVP